jgi:hypothetical protein
MGQPAYLKSTAYAPQAPYVGAELAQLTSMTPFMAGDFVPVRVMKRSVPVYDGFLDNLKARFQAKKAPPDAPSFIVQLGLKKGDKGPAVAQLQQAISQISGPPIAADGIFGDETEAALIGYQSVNGLVATGYVDAATKAHMADPSGDIAAYTTQQVGKAQTKAAAGAAVAEVLKAAFVPEVAKPSGQYVIQQRDTTPWGLIAVGGILTVAIIGGVIAATR